MTKITWIAAATAAAVLLWACSEERPPEQANTDPSTGTETESESGTESDTESDTETETESDTETESETESESESESESELESESDIPEELRAVEGERPAAAVARCDETSDPNRCIVIALDEAPELRARERQRVIEAHEALGNEARMLDHMEAFLEAYPRDRRSNRIRLRLEAEGRI